MGAESSLDVWLNAGQRILIFILLDYWVEPR
jgi:hypothetical protein